MRILKSSICSSRWSFHGDMNPKLRAAPLSLTSTNGGARATLPRFLSVPAAIEFQEQHDWDKVRATCHRLACETWGSINALTGLTPLHATHSAESWFAQMTVSPLPAETDIFALKKRLYDEYHIEIPLIDWHGNKLTRLSVQGYNSKRDTDVLLNALEQLIT